METLTIKNLNLLVKLDRMAQQAYGHIATYKNDPLPNISLARLRDKMKDSEPTMDKDNSIDYGYNQYKHKNFIRFIHNAGEGFTHWVDKGKWTYIPDKHTTINKDWTVIAGTMDGAQWLSDRNRSAKPRFVCEIAIPSYNRSEWENAKEIVQSVN